MNITISSGYDLEDANGCAYTNVLIISGMDNQPSDVKYTFLIDIRDLCRGRVCILDQSVMGT